MRLFISTPASGGFLYDRYVGSLLASVERAKIEGIISECMVHFQGKESLIHRARNHAAHVFIQSEFDKLLTIDADITWTYEDLKRIVTSDKEIIGGTYPIKNFPVCMNFNALEGRGTEFLKTGRGYDLDAWSAFVHKYADSEGLVEVRHLPTGFLCATRDVFAKLSHTVEVYHSRQPETGEIRGYFHFYPSEINEGSLESEDWGWCRLAREAGFKIYLDTKVTLGHVGSWEFRLGQFFGEGGVGLR